VDCDFPAATSARPAVDWEGHTTRELSQLEEYRERRAFTAISGHDIGAAGREVGRTYQ
jgi:hypothetical protein